MKVQILNITNKAFRYYRNRVKGNKGITHDLARRKLTRNVELAMLAPPRNQEDIDKGNKLYIYGNLSILVRDGWVIDLKNHRGINAYSGWELDRFKYVDLTIKLGIVEG
jgi:hypothetical protein